MDQVIEQRHAELEEVWARGGEIRVVGVAPAGGLWSLRLVPQRRVMPRSWRGRLVYCVWRVRMARRRPPGPYEVTIAGLLFEATIPIGDFVLPWPVRSERWDVYLVGEGAELRLGWHGGVPPKARAITFPAQRHRGGLKVRPYYTDDNHLSIGSRRAR